MKKMFFYFALAFTGIAVNAQKFLPEAYPVNGFTELSQETSVQINRDISMKEKAGSMKKNTLQSYKSPARENGAKEQLDSIVTKDAGGINLSKSEYRYNVDGKQVLSVNYTWNTTIAGWRETSKTEYVHGKDENNNITQVRINYSWDGLNSKWRALNKQESTFHENSNIYKYNVNYSWNENEGLWMPTSKLEQLYNEEGCSVLTSEYVWNNDAKQWKGRRKQGYIYNEDETLTLSEISYLWDDDANLWIEKNSLDYDANRNLTGQTKYSWNAGTSSWQGVSKVMYEYSFNEKITIKTSYEWSDGSHDWIKVSKEESAYDGNNHRTIYTLYQWNSTGAKWVGISKESLTYDQSGNQTSRYNYSWSDEDRWILRYSLNTEWDNITGSWEMISRIKYTYNDYGMETSFEQMHRNSSTDPWIANFTWKRETTYDADRNQSMQIFSDWDKINNTWKYTYKNEYITNAQRNITQRIRSDWNGSTWFVSQQTTYFYSTVSGTESPAYAVSVYTYPNPANDLLVVAGTTSGKNIRLTDMNGRIVGSYATEESQTKINISSMSKGVYFVDVDGVTIKVVKN